MPLAYIFRPAALGQTAQKLNFISLNPVTALK
jgi:hypothetical protein